MDTFKPHSKKQSQIIRSATNPKIKVAAAITGLQWGKTIAGAWWLRIKVHEEGHSSANFIVTAPTYKIMQQSSLPAFMEVFTGMGDYYKNEACFKIRGGGTVYFRTGIDPDSVVGVTNVCGIWCDEAGKYTKYFWENIQGRAAFRNCPICITTTPYSLNWIYKEIIIPVRNGTREDILLINASSNENPYFNKEVYADRKATMNPRKFRSMYCGAFEQMQGLVYDCFSEDVNIVNPAEVDFPIGTRYVAGVDWGHTDPFVIVVRAITPDGRHYQIAEFYKTGMVLAEMIQMAKMLQSVHDIQAFYCGFDQPGHIESFNRNGLVAVKANNDIDLGIETHYSLIKSGRYKILENTSPQTLDELSTYHYPEPQDLKPDQAHKKPKPVDKDNHASDANRYATVMTTQTTYKRSPKLPQERPAGALNPRPFQKRRHKNKITRVRDSEEWS